MPLRRMFHRLAQCAENFGVRDHDVNLDGRSASPYIQEGDFQTIIFLYLLSQTTPGKLEEGHSS